MSERYILSDSPDLLYSVTDLDGLIVSSNELFNEYCSHIKPKKLSDLMSEDSDLDEYVIRVKKAKDKSPEAVRLYSKTKQKNGSNHWILWNIYCILGLLHFVGIQMTDVTSISAHEYERQKNLLDDFRFMLSHELLSPLSSIDGLVKLAIQDNPDSTEFKLMDECVQKLKGSFHQLVKKAAREL